ADHFVQADVSTREGVDCVVQATLDRLGGLDILINTVGGAPGPRGGGAGPAREPLPQAPHPDLLPGRPPCPRFPSVLPPPAARGTGSSPTCRRSSGGCPCSRPRWRTPPPRPRSPPTARGSRKR